MQDDDPALEDDAEQSRARLLRDRLRVGVITVAEAEASKRGLTISQPVMTALCDLTHNFTEQLAKELELFAHHAGRKSVNMDDVILAGRRNEDVASTLKAVSVELAKSKEQQQAERKRKKPASKSTADKPPPHPHPHPHPHVVID